MEINFRPEQVSDYSIVERLIADAFRNEAFSDQSEHLLVARLRQSEAFIPALSIVAEHAGQIVGHILLTRLQIQQDQQYFPSLALAPVSVAPLWQGKGIGGRLIEEAHRVARGLGHSSVVLLGHENYYPRFGYQKASNYQITLPFEAPEENCLVIALREGGLEGVSGRVVYPSAFYD